MNNKLNQVGGNFKYATPISLFSLVIFTALLVMSLVATVFATIAIMKRNAPAAISIESSISDTVNTSNSIDNEAFEENFIEPFPALVDDSGSEYLLVADKVDRVLYLLRRLDNRWGVIKSFPIAIGAVEGRKKSGGDKKTPEGLYFIVGRKEARELNRIYGPLSYVLNYPNRRDTLEQRTGQGIWIHGTEPGKVPVDTKGCLELHNRNLLKLASYLKDGHVVPVIIHNNPDFQFRKDIDLVMIRDERKRLASSDAGSMVSRSTAEGDSAMTFSLQNNEDSVAKQVDEIRGEFSVKSSESPAPIAPKREAVVRSKPTIAPKVALQNQIETWRSGWVSENIAQYQSCYDTAVFHGEGMKWSAWRSKKMKTFQNYSKIQVDLSEITISVLNDSTATALFRQKYRSDLFTADNGKKLLFKKSGDTWRIVEEVTVRL